MLVAEEKLRWYGMDLRSRGRRRVAVGLTYVVFGLAVWNPQGRMTDLVWALWLATWCWPFAEGMIRNSLQRQARGVRWLANGYFVLGFSVIGFGAIVKVFSPPKGVLVDLTVGLLAYALLGTSVVGAGVLVETVQDDWRVDALRRASELSGKQQRQLAKETDFVIGREGFAWYEYGEPFAKLPTEKQAAVDSLVLENPRGKWMSTQWKPPVQDERLRNEELKLRAQAQRAQTLYLLAAAFVLTYLLKGHDTVPVRWLMVALWLFAGYSATWLQAAVVWSEPDPREAGAGELSVLRGQEV